MIRNLLSSLFFVSYWVCFDRKGGTALADRNVTVDDLDVSKITYSSGWSEASFGTGLQYGGSHAFSLTMGATATFTFTGTAIYYLAPGWPYTVNTQLTLDNGLPEVALLVDPSHQGAVGGPPTSPSIVRWSRTGLENTTHTLVASMAPQGSYVVIDALIYTVSDSDSSTSNTQSAQTVAATSPSSSSTNAPSTSTRPKSTSRTAGIVGATLGGVVALLLLLIAALLLFRRKRNRNATNDQTYASGKTSRGRARKYDPGMQTWRPAKGNGIGTPGYVVAPLEGWDKTQVSAFSPPVGASGRESNSRAPAASNHLVGVDPSRGQTIDYDQRRQQERQQHFEHQQQQQHSKDSQYGTSGSYASSGSYYSQELDSPHSQSSPGVYMSPQKLGGQAPPASDSRQDTFDPYHLSGGFAPLRPKKSKVNAGEPLEDGGFSLYPQDMVQATGGHVYGERLSTVAEGSQYSGATSPRSGIERVL